MIDNAGHDVEAVRVQPRNWQEPVLLLCLRERDSYGYELMERSWEFGLADLNSPTAYRSLRQMEKEGVIESGWETSRAGPARRVYSITDAGIDYLRSWAEFLRSYQQTTKSFLRTYADE